MYAHVSIHAIFTRPFLPFSSMCLLVHLHAQTTSSLVNQTIFLLEKRSGSRDGSNPRIRPRTCARRSSNLLLWLGTTISSVTSFPDSSLYRCTVHHKGTTESSSPYKRLATALLPGSQLHSHPLVQRSTCNGSQPDQWQPTSDNHGGHSGADTIPRH